MMQQLHDEQCKSGGNQLGPRYEGELIFMAEPIPHPKRPPHTPLRRSSFFAADGKCTRTLREHYFAQF